MSVSGKFSPPASFSVTFGGQITSLTVDGQTYQVTEVQVSRLFRKIVEIGLPECAEQSLASPLVDFLEGFLVGIQPTVSPLPVLPRASLPEPAPGQKGPIPCDPNRTGSDQSSLSALASTPPVFGQAGTIADGDESPAVATPVGTA